MTIAERDKIDEVVRAMPREWQQRALKNIDPDLIIEAANERFKEYAEFVESIRKIGIKYENRSWDLITLWNEANEYKIAVKEAHYKK